MKSVLIVDDAMVIRANLKMMLERNGYQIAGEAGDGQTAVAQYQALKPDIVTMDITMPQMDGIAALKEIRRIDPGAKIVMVSAMGQEKMVREAIVAGAKSFIVKPFNEEFVVKTLAPL